MTRLRFSAIALAAALASLMSANAQELLSAHVGYGDLDLTSSAGVKALHRRLETALTQVCGDYDARDSGRTGGVNACRDRTWLEVAQMERRAVAAAKQTAMLASADTQTPAR